MRVWLPDVNVLFALVWPNHPHYEPANAWFRGSAASGWATCPITQCGFVRLSCNPTVNPLAALPDTALEALRRMTAHPAHIFWPADLDLSTAAQVAFSSLLGHRQVTDAYLLALAMRHDGCVVTFDRGLEQLRGADVPAECLLALSP